MRGRNNCIPQIDGVIGERLPAMGASKELIRTIKKKKIQGDSRPDWDPTSESFAVPTAFLLSLRPSPRRASLVS